MNVLAIIPAYNEEECIVRTVEELKDVAPWCSFVVVNDGSVDRTSYLCNQHKYPIIDLPVNLGLAYGFQAGMKYALRGGFDAAVQFDADGQHMPQALRDMVNAMELNGSDVVLGSRFMNENKGYSARMIGSRLISAFIKLTTGKAVNDPTSGLRLYNRSAIEFFALNNEFGPEPDSIAYLIRHGFKVDEVQVKMRERLAGESYLNVKRSIEYMVRTCASILFAQWFR